jgi:hypothetical protein
MALEMLGGLIAKEFHRIAALDERLPLASQALQLDRAYLRAILVFLAIPLRLLILVEIALNPVGSTLEEVARSSSFATALSPAGSASRAM